MADDDAHQPSALVFVYNADGGVFNLLSDAAHKLLSPRTYACNLCRITHSTFGMREPWKRFLRDLNVPLEFLHADELRSRYGIAGVPLPAVFEKAQGALRPWISADEINRCTSMEELKRLISDRSPPARSGEASA